MRIPIMLLSSCILLSSFSSCETTKALPRDYWVDCVESTVPVMLNARSPDPADPGFRVGFSMRDSRSQVTTTTYVQPIGSFDTTTVTSQSTTSAKIPIHIQIARGNTTDLPVIYLSSISVRNLEKHLFLGLGWADTDECALEAIATAGGTAVLP